MRKIIEYLTGGAAICSFRMVVASIFLTLAAFIAISPYYLSMEWRANEEAKAIRIKGAANAAVIRMQGEAETFKVEPLNQ